ncbi:cytochrome P450 [Streptomyces fuscichromogenes]|uniref:Cytochrome P450 n=1 Tax=Streptomyces fuscichromogenes TaxID=1324013 RepID=A0A917XQB8_9ACTN|nr:cytochrome P450 [Streptomyces fuscichromogenes]GGN47425.1 cytochrome P450 [Streptomyces fuscichromogenes]
MPRSCPFGPPSQYARLRAEEPVSRVRLQNGASAWLLTRYDDVRSLLSNSATTSNRAHPAFPATVANTQAFAQKGFLLSMDAPEHALHRRMVTGEFTAHRVRRLRPRIQEIVDTCVGRMLVAGAGGRPVDLVQELSLPVPSLVICELLGVSYASRSIFQKNTEVLLNRTSTAADREGAFGALRDFLGELVTSKERAPDETLLGRLIVKYREADLYDHEHLTGFAMLLLLAGHETTANMISLGVTVLLDGDRARLDELAADPSLMPQAVEELLRYLSIVDYPTSRVLLEETEVSGVRIGADEGFIASGAAANHDPEVFPDPGRFDMYRSTAGHVAFGFGVHACLGQNLARAELEIVFNTLFARTPGLRLVRPAGRLPYKDSTVYGIHTLEVTW